MKRRISDPDLRFILVRLAIAAGIIAVVCVLAVLGLGALNSPGDGDQGSLPTDEGTTDPFAEQDSIWAGDGVALPEQQMMSEGPEASWELSPCSLYVSAGSSPVVDSLPESPLPEWKVLEALLVVKSWAAESGLGEEYIDNVYVFNKLDTIFVDLPSALDVGGLKATLESRFICFTRLFPLVGGNLMASYPDGLSLRGVSGVFGN